MEYNNIDKWILYRSKRGKLTFSRQGLVADFSFLSEQTIKKQFEFVDKKRRDFSCFQRVLLCNSC